MRGKRCGKRRARANSCQRIALTIWETSNRPSAASQYSPRKAPKARRTLGQSVCQAIQPSKRPLTVNRSTLVADIELLYVQVPTELVEPAVIFLDHINQHPIAAGPQERRRRQGDGEA